MPNRSQYPLPNDPLSAIARFDADRITPGFSPTLHSRIVDAVHSTPHPVLQITSPTLHSTPLALAIAALIALIVAPVSIFWMRSAGTPQVVVAPSPVVHPIETPAPVPTVSQAAHEVNLDVASLVQTAMAEQQWAGLDHDVRLMTRYLVDQVPLRLAWDSPAPQQDQ